MIKVREKETGLIYDLVMWDRTRNLVVVKNEEFGEGNLKLDSVDIIEDNERSDSKV
jgi:hypothetical protein